MEEQTYEMEDVLELGGNIKLAGFGEVDSGSMIILKKIIGNYVKQLSECNKGFECLKLTMKKIHETEGSTKFDVKAQLMINGTPHNADYVDRNIFMTVDKILKKIEASV